jgi:hypothetical protein
MDVSIGCQHSPPLLCTPNTVMQAKVAAAANRVMAIRQPDSHDERARDGPCHMNAYSVSGFTDRTYNEPEKQRSSTSESRCGKAVAG